MTSDSGARRRPLLLRWVIASTLGWLLGFFLVILLALSWDGLGIGVVQFMVGVGMGAGVGLMQGRIAREWLGSVRPWFWATTLGLGIPFVLADLLSAVVPFSLGMWIGAGALLVGVLQARLLRPHGVRAVWWVPASAAGWLIAASPTAFEVGGLGLIGTVLVGGAALGLVTGLPLDAALRQAPGDLETAPAVMRPVASPVDR